MLEIPGEGHENANDSRPAEVFGALGKQISADRRLNVDVGEYGHGCSAYAPECNDTLRHFYSSSKRNDRQKDR